MTIARDILFSVGSFVGCSGGAQDKIGSTNDQGFSEEALSSTDTLTSAQGGTILASYVKSGLHGAGKKVGAIYVNQSAYKAAVDTFTAESKRQGMTIRLVSLKSVARIILCT